MKPSPGRQQKRWPPRQPDWSTLARLPEVRSMGLMLMDPIWSRKRHSTRGTCELIHVLAGSVDITLARGHVTGKPGDTLLLPSDTPHRDNFDTGPGLKVFMVFFSWSAEREYFRWVRPAALPVADPRTARDLERQVDRLRLGLGAGTEADRLLASSLMHTLLLTILRDRLYNTPAGRGRDRPAYGDRRRRQLMQQARQYLDEHFAEPISLDHIARWLNVSPFYLSHVFSRESEFSLFATLTRLRMERARKLLQAGRLSVKETAHAVGYEDESYFAKVFRKHVGVTPQAARAPASR